MLNEEQKRYVNFWLDYDIGYYKNELSGCKEILKSEKDKNEIKSIKENIEEYEDKLQFLFDFKEELKGEV